VAIGTAHRHLADHLPCLRKRIITLDMNMTKERRAKRVPISRILIPDFEKANREAGEAGDALNKLRNLLQQSVVILSGNLLSFAHAIANTGHGHFQLAELTSGDTTAFSSYFGNTTLFFFKRRFRGVPASPLLRSRPVSFSTVASPRTGALHRPPASSKRAPPRVTWCGCLAI
jgi:hypothetical protein